MSFNIEQWNSKVGSVLGWEVFCTVKDKRVGRDAYKDTFNTMFGYEPEVDSDVMAFSEAVHDVCKENGAFEKKVLEENGKHSFRLCRSKVNRDEKNVKFAIGFLVEWDDKNKVLSFSDDTHKMVQMIRDRFESYRQTVSDHKFRQNYKHTVLENGGISLRDTGGIYFLPNVNGNKKIIDNLQNLFKDFDNGKLYPIAFEDKGGCEREVVWEAVSSSVSSAIEEISEELNVSKKRACGLETLLDKAVDAKELLQGYSSLLDKAVEAQAFVEQLETLANKATERIEALRK